MKRLVSIFFLLSSCASPWLGCNESRETSWAVEAIEEEVAALRKAQGSVELEMRLLEERIDKQGKQRWSSLTERVRELQQQMVSFKQELTRIREEIVQENEQHARSLREQVALLRHLAEKAKEGERTKEKKKYRVKEGDSIHKISRQFQISSEELKRENQLSSDKIGIGQELVIPERG